jgi:hypothetical protein
VSDQDPLAPEQKQRLAAATVERDRLLRPARLARMNGWSLGIFGGLSILIGLVTGGGGILVGAALVALAWNEMRGVALLRRLDPEGARILGWNQIAVGGVVAVYCAAAIVRSRMAPNASMQELEELAGISGDLMSELTTVFYGSVAIVVGIVQGLLARYHFRAGPRLAAFRRATPGWIIDLWAIG